MFLFKVAGKRGNFFCVIQSEVIPALSVGLPSEADIIALSYFYAIINGRYRTFLSAAMAATIFFSRAALPAALRSFTRRRMTAY